MSSEHQIVVARHDNGLLHLPLGDTTLYGVGTEEQIVQSCAKRLDSNWQVTLYGPVGDTYTGRKNPASFSDLLDRRDEQAQRVAAAMAGIDRESLISTLLSWNNVEQVETMLAHLEKLK